MDIFIVTTRYTNSRLDPTSDTFSTAFSSYDKAVEDVERKRRANLNPQPMSFTHYDTDQEGVEQWVGTFTTASGDIAYEIITRYPLDAPFPFVKK